MTRCTAIASPWIAGVLEAAISRAQFLKSKTSQIAELIPSNFARHRPCRRGLFWPETVSIALYGCSPEILSGIIRILCQYWIEHLRIRSAGALDRRRPARPYPRPFTSPRIPPDSSQTPSSTIPATATSTNIASPPSPTVNLGILILQQWSQTPLNSSPQP